MDEQCIDAAGQLRAALRQKLRSLQQAGVQQLHKPPHPDRAAPHLPDVTAETAAAGPQRAARPQTPPAVPDPQVSASRSHTPNGSVVPKKTHGDGADGDRPSLLDSLRHEVVGCSLCADLVQNRTQTVFGAGDPQTRLCFLGEAPGADEDRTGKPFVGQAGQLLDRIIAACTLQREQVYILNVLKCRPPRNRTPLPDEVANCRVFFERQLEIIAPEFICCLGAVAAQSLLRTTQSLGRLRGRFHDFRGSKVLVTYHPAYLLRSPNMKRAAWDDMKMLMQEMGIEIPGR